MLTRLLILRSYYTFSSSKVLQNLNFWLLKVEMTVCRPGGCLDLVKQLRCNKSLSDFPAKSWNVIFQLWMLQVHLNKSLQREAAPLRAELQLELRATQADRWESLFQAKALCSHSSVWFNRCPACHSVSKARTDRAQCLCTSQEQSGMFEMFHLACKGRSRCWLLVSFLHSMQI